MPRKYEGCVIQNLKTRCNLLITVTFFIFVSSRAVVAQEMRKAYPVKLVNVKGLTSLNKIDSALMKSVDMAEAGGELELTNELSKKKKVRNCKEYFESIREGYSAYSTYDRTMESWFINQCLPLRALKQAKFSKISYLSDSFLADNPLKTLPIDLIFILSSNNAQRLRISKVNGLTLKEFIPDIVIESANNNQIILKSKKEGTTTVNLLALGDFNNDGIEDALVFVSHYVSEGSFRNFEINILTRLKRLDRIIVVPLNI